MRRSRSRSLRFKLTSWFVLVFFAIQVTLAVGVVLLRRGEIARTLDGELEASARAMIESVLVERRDLTVEDLAPLVPVGAEFLLYAVRDDGGEIRAAWNVDDQDLLPFSDWETVPAGTVGPVFTPVGSELAAGLVPDGGSVRFITVPFRYRDEAFYFQAAVRDRVLERLLGPFFDLVVVGVPVGLVAALIAAWVIAGRAVSPIDRLSAEVRDVSPSSLDKRLRSRTNDQEISRLESELNSALERIEAGYRAQEQFISNVSHELKTPIAVLLTEAQVAKLGARELETAFGFVDRVEGEMKRLSELVESLLTLARADILENRPLEPVSVNDMVLQSVQHCMLLATQSETKLIPNLVVSDDADPVVLGDPALLQTMVDNLVRNAIAQSPAEVAIDARSDGEALEIVVRDNGPGIPEEYLDRIFDRFVQAPNRSRHEGSGLGLTIAKGVAELHRGTIQVRNNDDAGCSFVVRLPLDRSALGQSA